MQRNFKAILSTLFILLINLSLIAQSEVEFKDVMLDGKPAKLNVKTGEITLVKNADKKVIDIKNIKTDSTKTVESVSDFNTTDFHVVKEGETLLDVARQYKVSLTELKRVNNLETTLINIGQTLRVKNLEVESVSVSIYDSSIAIKNNTSNFHIVESGETLYSLSRRYHISLNELKSKNSLNTNVIKVGQKLRVSNFLISNEDDYISVWTVKKGDTLFSIAKKSGTSVEGIKQLNGLTSNNIMIGQILQLK